METDSPPPEHEEEIRQRIIRERDIEEQAARDKDLEDQSEKLDQEIAQEIRGKHFLSIISKKVLQQAFAELTDEERSSIFAAPEFLDFVEQSSKIVQRALNDGYDYIRDYTIGTESGG